MEIKTAKVEVPFKEIAQLDLFMYSKKVYMKIPEITGEFDGYVGNGLTSKNKCTYNAINICLESHFYDRSDYSHFVANAMVTPLKTELTIYGVTQ